MTYCTETLVQEALDAGFSQAARLNMDALEFSPSVRDMCGADLCRQYGKNWCCPPACGTLADAEARASQYSYGIIVQTIGKMDDDFDYDTIEATSKKHKENFQALTEKLRAQYGDILPMGAGTCTVCETCTYPDAPCRYPQRAIPSMEAFGLWVSRVCQLSDIPYNNGKKTITYTSCYLLK